MSHAVVGLVFILTLQCQLSKFYRVAYFIVVGSEQHNPHEVFRLTVIISAIRSINIWKVLEELHHLNNFILILVSQALNRKLASSVGRSPLRTSSMGYTMRKSPGRKSGAFWFHALLISFHRNECGFASRAVSST